MESELLNELVAFGRSRGQDIAPLVRAFLKRRPRQPAPPVTVRPRKARKVEPQPLHEEEPSDG